jgi:adenylate cyclase
VAQPEICPACQSAPERAIDAAKGDGVRERTKARLQLVVRVTLVSAVIGIALALVSGASRAGALVTGAMQGALIGATLSGLEAFGLSARGGTLLRHTPLALVLALRTGLYTLCIAAIYALVSALSGEARDIADLGRTIAYSLAVSLVLSLALMVRRMLGPQATAHFLTGRYYRPRVEERLVLFLDVEGSTALAEHIGDALFHEFLARTVLDVSESVVECGGEIHAYAGDQVIVTWKLRHGRADRRALLCPFVVADRVAEHRAEYVRRFGVAPALRAGFHAGPLIIGEMGDVKREIVMLGDTMNTAARIEAACRNSGHPVLVSPEALTRTVLPPALRAESIGSVALRGKSSGRELFALALA